jgi:hypothetical protein
VRPRVRSVGELGKCASARARRNSSRRRHVDVEQVFPAARDRLTQLGQSMPRSANALNALNSARLVGQRTPQSTSCRGRCR